MGFLIRTVFWFSLVLLLLPLDTGKSADGTPNAGAIQTFLAAREAVSDMAGLCERKPDVCEVGRSAFETIGTRARESARIAYELLDERFGEPDTSISTGSVPAVKPSEAVPAAN